MLHNTHAGQNSHPYFTVYTVAYQSGGDGGGMRTGVITACKCTHVLNRMLIFCYIPKEDYFLRNTI